MRDDMSMDEFVTRYLDTRDMLSYRQLRGEVLMPHDQVVLAALNRIADRLFPPPTPLPGRVVDLVDAMRYDRSNP